MLYLTFHLGVRSSLSDYPWSFFFEDVFFWIGCFMLLRFGLSEFRSAPALLDVFVGLCFGSGLLQVRLSLKSTTSLNWGGTFEISVTMSPYLTFPHRFYLFSLFWWLFIGFVFPWVVLAVQEGPFPEDNCLSWTYCGFFGPRICCCFFLCCYALVHAIVLRQLSFFLSRFGGPLI